MEMRRFRAVEATSIRLEEANRCAREMKQARADMDRWHEQAGGSACRETAFPIPFSELWRPI